MIEQSNHQKWDQKPKPFERHDSVPVARSDWLDTVLVKTRWLESIDRSRLGLPSLAFRPLRGQTAKNNSWSWQCLPCLSFLIFSDLARSAVIGLYLYVSASLSPSLTSMIASTWQSHKNRIITSTRVSLSFSMPWHISCLDMARTWCIRGSVRTDAEVKACQDI